MNAVSTRRKFMAVAVAGLILAAATACSSGAKAETSPAKVPEQGLISQLEAAGFEFAEPESVEERPFSEMAVARASVQHVRLDGNDTLWLHEFAGAAEALVAASRTSPSGSSFHFPLGADRRWHTVVNYAPALFYDSSYAGSASLSMFLDDKNIVVVLGESAELKQLVEELAGPPFAGSSPADAYLDVQEEFGDFDRDPRFADVWLQHPMRIADVETSFEPDGSDGTPNGYVRLKMLEPYSPLCAEESVYGHEVSGNELHITMRSRTANTDRLEFASDCDIDWQWVDTGFRFSGLTLGELYTVTINGEVMGALRAVGGGDS